MRYGMLNEHKDLIGSTRAFDGSTLYLPIKITNGCTNDLLTSRFTGKRGVCVCVCMKKGGKCERVRENKRKLQDGGKNENNKIREEKMRKEKEEMYSCLDWSVSCKTHTHTHTYIYKLYISIIIIISV